LATAEPDVAKYLQTLLGVKSEVADTPQPMSAGMRKKAARAAQNLIEAARRIARPPTAN
jgi:hypothetical protein